MKKKSNLFFLGLFFALVLGFAFAGCSNPAGDGETSGGGGTPDDGVLSAYRGIYKGYEDTMGGEILTFTLGEFALDWTGESGSNGGWNSVYTSGGGDIEENGEIYATWAYLYIDDSGKQGFVVKFNENNCLAFYSGSFALEVAADAEMGIMSLDLSDMDPGAINFYAANDWATATEVSGSTVNGLTFTNSAAASGGGTHYLLSATYDEALAALNARFETSYITGDKGLRSDSSLSSATNYVILEDISISDTHQLRLVQRVDGTISGVWWEKLY
jgi:hypothetical protein